MADLIQGGVIKVGFDGSDVEVGTQKAQRSVGDLGKAAESAGVQGAKGIDKLSDASKKAADTIDKAAQRESLAIQRRTAATLAGSASNAEFYRLIQQHKNINLLPEQAIAQLAAAERLVQKNILAEKQLAAAEADRANQLKKLIDVERERLAAAAQQRTSASALIKGYEGATKAQDNHYRSTK